MLTSIHPQRCAQCSGRMIDAEDELVCSSCGTVTIKEVVAGHGSAALGSVVIMGSPAGGTSRDGDASRRPHAVDYTSHALGSFLGPLEQGYGGETPRGFSRSSSTFRYLKTISDHSQRDEAGVYPCAKLIERICEKLSLPGGVMGQAITLSKRLLEIRSERTGYTIAAISAFSIITACRIWGVTSVGVREVINAHRALGYRMKPSTMIRIGFDSPVKVQPRRGEDYLGRVAAHLAEQLPSMGAPPGYQNRLVQVARKILGMVDSSERGGHSPCALAATGIYAAEMVIARSESRRRFFTQKEAAACVKVAEYTVREQFCQLFRPRIDEMYEQARPMLQSPGQPSRRFPSPPEPVLQA